MTDTKETSTSRRNALKGVGLAGLGISAMAALAPGAMAQTGPGGSAHRPLQGKVAIVTGARANMGRAFARALAEMGSDVVVHYHRASTVEQAEETARLVREAGGRAALAVGDLGDPETAKRMFDTAERAFCGSDILVNNAGAIEKKPLADFTDAEFERLNAVNNRGLFFALREAAQRLRDGGRIINNGTSLLAGAAPGYAIYAGTKAPVEEYTRMLALELGDRRITVNAIAPGPVDTPFFHSQETPQSAAYAAGLATEGRLGMVEDIVPLVRFLAAPDSQWVNGQTLFVNGGYLTR